VPESSSLDRGASGEAHHTPAEPRRRAVDRCLVAAIAMFLVALAVYVLTVLPGVRVGDWAESEMIPNRLGIIPAGLDLERARPIGEPGRGTTDRTGLRRSATGTAGKTFDRTSNCAPMTRRRW